MLNSTVRSSISCKNVLEVRGQKNFNFTAKITHFLRSITSSIIVIIEFKWSDYNVINFPYHALLNDLVLSLKY